MELRFTYLAKLFYYIVSPSSGGWELQIPGTGRFSVQWGPASWFIEGGLPPVSSYYTGPWELSQDSFVRVLIPFMRVQPSWVITSQSLHLQIQLHWTLGFNTLIWELGGQKCSVYSKAVPSSLPGRPLHCGFLLHEANKNFPVERAQSSFKDFTCFNQAYIE